LGILAPVLPQNEVYITFPPHHEVYKTTLPHNEVKRIIVPQNEAGLNKTVLLQSGMFKTAAVNYQLFDRVKTIINLMLNLRVESFNILTSALIHGGEKLC
jgi:hypothetical protein